MKPLRLKKHWFNILLALADGALHGYAIRTHVEGQTGGSVKLYPATLYGSIRELVERGAIEAVERGEEAEADQRRHYYRLTRLGRETLGAEVDRLQGLLDSARASRALSGA